MSALHDNPIAHVRFLPLVRRVEASTGLLVDYKPTEEPAPADNNHLIIKVHQSPRTQTLMLGTARRKTPS